MQKIRAKRTKKTQLSDPGTEGWNQKVYEERVDMMYRNMETKTSGIRNRSDVQKTSLAFLFFRQ